MSKKPNRVTEPATSVGLRRFLYATSAVTGSAIMIIQILGAKMLSPYIGTSHFVWTAQIAVTLVALAAGYYAGGRLADASTRLSRLYTCILLAAIYVTLSTSFVEPLAYWCLRFRLALGSLLASTLLFFIPLGLLAMTGPFLVRVLTFSLLNVGGNTGRLTAISTLGSFAGTILIGYILVPLLPNSVTMFLCSAMLVSVVATYFIVWGRSSRNATALAAGAAVVMLAGIASIRRDAVASFGSADELYRKNSNFGLLQVIQNKSGTRRLFLNDFLTQNTFEPQTGQSLSLFTYMLHDLARAYTPRLEHALCIGLGVGIVPMQLVRGGATVEVVEINPEVVTVATRHFGFEPDRFRIHLGDGRWFLNKAGSRRYDTVILDAFLGDSSPSHLMTREAFASMSRVLKPGGTLVINCFGDFQEGKDFLVTSLDKTLKTVFAGVRIHTAGNGNVFFVASDREDLGMPDPPDFSRVHPSVRPSAERAFASVATANPGRGIILTDEYNPTEFFDAGNRETWRRQLALSMRSL